MPPLRRPRKSRTIAPAVVYFTSARNEAGETQLCVYGECVYSGQRYGPVWSHTSAAVRRCLLELTRRCDCGRKFHKQKYSEGRRVYTPEQN